MSLVRCWAVICSRFIWPHLVPGRTLCAMAVFCFDLMIESSSLPCAWYPWGSISDLEELCFPWIILSVRRFVLLTLAYFEVRQLYPSLFLFETPAHLRITFVILMLITLRSCYLTYPPSICGLSQYWLSCYRLVIYRCSSFLSYCSWPVSDHRHRCSNFFHPFLITLCIAHRFWS